MCSGSVKPRWIKESLWEKLTFLVKAMNIRVFDIYTVKLCDEIEDPYVLAGSCGVEFYLEKNGNYANHHNHHHKNYYNESSNSSGGFFETIVMVFVIIFVFTGRLSCL